jgi:hypothetical protein
MFGIVPQLSHGRFLPNLFQFSVHRSSSHFITLGAKNVIYNRSSVYTSSIIIVSTGTSVPQWWMLLFTQGLTGVFQQAHETFNAHSTHTRRQSINVFDSKIISTRSQRLNLQLSHFWTLKSRLSWMIELSFSSSA